MCRESTQLSDKDKLLFIFTSQGLLSIALILAGNVTQLINGFSALQWMFYFLTFIALLIMRFTKRKEKRPFKV